MRYRKLGRSGLKISEIGFGTWGIGGSKHGAIGYGPTQDAQSKAALRKAFELGINFFDTADLYGFGHSENLIGEVFKKNRDKIIIASKAGFVSAAKQDFSPKHIRSAIEKSLRRLKSDYIDLYQLHDPPRELLRTNPKILETFHNLKCEGKIRFVGISAPSPDDAIEAVRKFKISAIQVNFNLADQRIVKNGLLALCRKKGVGIIGRTPLCFGFLTGSENETKRYGPKDHRRMWSGAQRKVWSGAYQEFSAALNALAQPPAQMALRFCLSYPEISSVIPGMFNPGQVRQNAAVSSLRPFKKNQLAQAEKIYNQKTFFLGAAARLKNATTQKK